MGFNKVESPYLEKFSLLGVLTKFKNINFCVISNGERITLNFGEHENAGEP